MSAFVLSSSTIWPPTTPDLNPYRTRSPMCCAALTCTAVPATNRFCCAAEPGQRAPSTTEMPSPR